MSAEPNTPWRVNRKDMKRCCYLSLQYEMYRRKGASEPLMAEGQIFKCSECSAEMICEIGESKKLRWGLKRDVG